MAWGQVGLLFWVCVWGWWSGIGLEVVWGGVWASLGESDEGPGPQDQSLLDQK